MAKEPWFKFYAADYLLDPDVDSLPLEARAVLLSMWCLCHLEGFCPATPEEIARKTRLPLEAIAKYREHLTLFFDLRDGQLYSRRMEEEKRRSEQARENANKRPKKQPAQPTAEQMAEPRSDSDSDSDSGFKNPPPFKKSGFTLEENARAREARKVPRVYDPEVGDAIDLRKLGKARDEMKLEMSQGWGSNLTDRQLIVEQCARASVSVKVALGVWQRSGEWPEWVNKSDLEASA